MFFETPGKLTGPNIFKTFWTISHHSHQTILKQETMQQQNDDSTKVEEEPRWPSKPSAWIRTKSYVVEVGRPDQGRRDAGGNARIWGQLHSEVHPKAESWERVWDTHIKSGGTGAENWKKYGATISKAGPDASAKVIRVRQNRKPGRILGPSVMVRKNVLVLHKKKPGTTRWFIMNDNKWKEFRRSFETFFLLNGYFVK